MELWYNIMGDIYARPKTVWQDDTPGGALVYFGGCLLYYSGTDICILYCWVLRFWSTLRTESVSLNLHSVRKVYMTLCKAAGVMSLTKDPVSLNFVKEWKLSSRERKPMFEPRVSRPLTDS